MLCLPRVAFEVMGVMCCSLCYVGAVLWLCCGRVVAVLRCVLWLCCGYAVVVLLRVRSVRNVVVVLRV